MAAVSSIGRANRIEGPPAHEADRTRALYEQYAPQIFRYCLHQLGSREEAEDAVQSTFLNAFRGLKRGIVPEAESAWLFKIAQNVCLSRRRSSWRRDRIESPTDFDLVEALTPAPSRRPDELIGLQDVLEGMPEQQRRAILLREWQGLSYREIGEELRLSQAAVETLIFRARRSLAQGLEQPAQQPRRRRLAAGALGNLLTSAQSFFLSGGGAVKVAAVVAAASAGTVVATAPVHRHAPVVPVAPTHAAKPAHHVTSTSVATNGNAEPAAVDSSTGPMAPHRPAAVHVAPSRPAATPVHHRSVSTPVQSAPAPASVTTPAAPQRPAQSAAVYAPPAAPGHGKASAPGQLKKQAARQSAAPPAGVTPPAGPPAATGRDAAPGQLKKADPQAQPQPPVPAPAPPAAPSDNGSANGNGGGNDNGHGKP